MAIIQYKGNNQTVETIADRSAITRLVDGMVVIVQDAIADPIAGPGVATYRYNATTEDWILISTSNVNTVQFNTEELTVAGGSVTLSYYPLDNQLWGMTIIEGDVIIGDIRLEDVTVTDGVVSGLEAYDGKSLRITYAYGSQVAAINSMLGDTSLSTTEEILAELPTV